MEISLRCRFANVDDCLYLLQLDYESEEAVRLLVAAAGKLQMLERLLPALHRNGHRTLIFSQVGLIAGMY